MAITTEATEAAAAPASVPVQKASVVLCLRVSSE